MKQLGYRKRLTQYARLLRINAVNTWQVETAYFGNGWGNLLSTVAYTATFIVFISVIYANVRTMAGYTRDQMLFLSFIGQVNFYAMYVWVWNNLQRLVEDVNRGSFDLVLAKPLPSLFYTSTRNISLLPQLRDGLPSLLIVALVINWHNVTVSWLGALCGIVIILAGQLAVQTFGLLLALPVFWFGQASDSLNLGYVIFSGTDIPYEGVPQVIRFVLIYAIPVLIPSTLATSVMLGKLNVLTGLLVALSATAILTLVKRSVWKRALANYASASS